VSGKDAMTQIQAEQDFDAILLDLRMRGLSGQEVYDHLPVGLKSRVIFISGDVNNPANARFLREVNRPTLLKPLSARSLFDAIDSIKAS
jgi:CheY-like chemotaxis protein